MKPMKSSVKVVLSVVFGFVYPIILLFLTGLFEFLVQSDSFSWYFEILLGTVAEVLFLILENRFISSACPITVRRTVIASKPENQALSWLKIALSVILSRTHFLMSSSFRPEGRTKVQGFL